MRVCIFRRTRRAVDCGLGGVEDDITHKIHFAELIGWTAGGSEWELLRIRNRREMNQQHVNAA